MSTIRIVGIAVVASALIGSLAFARQGVKVGAKAPDFTATGADGKTYDLKSLAKNGDVYLYFIKIGCPVNHRAAPHFKKIANAYGAKANLIGVIDGDVNEAKQWAKEYGTSFTILADPKLKIIRAYGAQYSPWVVHVSKGKVAKVWDEGSSKTLTVLNKLAATTAGKKVAMLNFDGAPTGGG